MSYYIYLFKSRIVHFNICISEGSQLSACRFSSRKKEQIFFFLLSNKVLENNLFVIINYNVLCPITLVCNKQGQKCKNTHCENEILKRNLIILYIFYILHDGCTMLKVVWRWDGLKYRTASWTLAVQIPEEAFC